MIGDFCYFAHLVVELRSYAIPKLDFTIMHIERMTHLSNVLIMFYYFIDNFQHMN
jgi:hypothetical protein